jgi:multidrug transporter EmrE-like cation transporter
MHYIVSLISIGLGTAAQFFFKLGVNSITQKGNGTVELVKLGMTNLHLWCGMVCYGVSLLMWFYVLSQMELSRAFPLVSIGYVAILLLGYFFLNEPMSVYKIIGVALIVIGVIFISK